MHSPGRPQTFCSSSASASWVLRVLARPSDWDWDSALSQGSQDGPGGGALGHSHDCGEERLIRPFKGNKGAHGVGLWFLLTAASLPTSLSHLVSFLLPISCYLPYGDRTQGFSQAGHFLKNSQFSFPTHSDLSRAFQVRPSGRTAEK